MEIMKEYGESEDEVDNTQANAGTKVETSESKEN